MAKRRSGNATRFSVSPIHPSLHFVMFLVLALVLVVVVAVVMRQTSVATRARFACPQIEVDPVNLVQELSKRCSYGVEYVTDKNGCSVWVCRKQPSLSP